MKISVVAIFYNSVPWMRRCIDSILSQQGDFELELIAVDDCSTDHHTVEILEDYAETDERVKLIRHERNQGISATRNTGMRHVTGDCFYLIDGDDYLPEGALAKLAPHFAEDIDWVQGGYSLEDEEGKEIRAILHPDAVYATHQQIAENFDKLELDWVHNRLIHAKYKDIPFSTGRLYEDTLWILGIFPQLAKIVCVASRTYCYIWRSSSVSKTRFKTPTAIDDAIYQLHQMSLNLEYGWGRTKFNGCLIYIEGLLYEPNPCIDEAYRRQARKRLKSYSHLVGDLSSFPRKRRWRHRLIASSLPDAALRALFSLHYLLLSIREGGKHHSEVQA